MNTTDDTTRSTIDVAGTAVKEPPKQIIDRKTISAPNAAVFVEVLILSKDARRGLGYNVDDDE